VEPSISETEPSIFGKELSIPGKELSIFEEANSFSRIKNSVVLKR
jgi:hypothetical protein